MNNYEGNEDEINITEKLRISMYLLFSLSFFRLFCVQFYCLITDLIAAFIVYCTYTGKGRIMALFCLINAILGVIYSISSGSMDISKINSSKGNQKGGNFNNNNIENPNNKLNNMNYNNYGNGINNNKDNNNKNSINYGNEIISDKYDKGNGNYNNNNYFDTGSQENFNSLYNSGQLSNYKKQDSTNFTVVYIMAVTVYAVILYCAITFFSYKAYEIFKSPFGDIYETEQSGGSNNQQNNAFGGGPNYGGTEQSNQVRQSTGNFVPFGGGGHRLEE